MIEEQYIAIVGDPLRGFNHYGPFDDFDTAIDWVEKMGVADWCIAPLRGHEFADIQEASFT